jgi:uncharacterized protein (DUF362 family)
VGAIYEEFERQLQAWREQYAGQPRLEMIRLCLLALEREELVSVAYREDLIAKRLASMPVNKETREIVRHALVWAWKDEEMHAVYIRGLILKLGGRRLRAMAYARQMAGALGGWAGSVRQHVGWRDAPLSRAIASTVMQGGQLLGQIPPEVRQHLKYGSFRAFCSFNVDAEKTARLCWRRLAELARQDSTLRPSTVEDFRRVEADELRHEQIFAILAGAFDDSDRLVDGESEGKLAHSIGGVSEFFLPRRLRGPLGANHPLGAGGKVWVAAGETAEQKLDFFHKLLDESELSARLRERARASGKALADVRVAIKPTFMMGYDRRDKSVITDPALVDVLAAYLRQQGCRDIAVVEGRNIYDEFFENRSVEAVARYFGVGSGDYRVVDGSAEQVPHSYYRGMAQYTISRTWSEADFRITFGKMRSHPIELAYLSTGNVEWMGARCDQFMFPERQAERQTAIMMLLDEFPPHFALLDAYDSAADGLIGVMGCPRPKSPKRFYAAADALALDIVAARHLKVNEPGDSSILRAAIHWFGDPAARTEVIGCDEPIAGWRDPYHNEISALLSFFAFPVYVYGSGRGTLFVPEMDEQAFPPRRRSWPVRIARRATIRLLGLRLLR